MKKTLRLRAESLTELSTADLGAVAGAAPLATYECSAPKCPSLDYCDPLPTTPIRVCLPPK